MRWTTPLEDKVWDNPIGALWYIFKSSGRGYGEEDSIMGEEGPVWPQPTEDPVTRQTGENVLDEMFPGQVQEMVSELEEEGFETPDMFSKSDLERFDMLEISEGIQKDTDILMDQIEYYDRVFSMILRNWDQITSGEVVEVPQELDDDEDEEESEEDDSGGRFTTSDVMEREEREVMGVLNRSTVMDDESDDLFETFRFAYEKRDTDGVTIADVSDGIGIPDSLAEQNLEDLSERNFVNHDTDTDRYYIPY